MKSSIPRMACTRTTATEMAGVYTYVPVPPPMNQISPAPNWACVIAARAMGKPTRSMSPEPTNVEAPATAWIVDSWELTPSPPIILKIPPPQA